MQKLTGKSSTPRAISNTPTSIFKEESTVATRKHAAQVAVAAAAESTVAAEPTVGEIAAGQVERIAEQRKAAEQTAKPAKAPRTPKDPAKVAAAVAKLNQTPLERVVAQQATRVDNGIARMFARKVAALVTAGMSTEDAVRKVLGGVSTDTADALVELEGTAGKPGNGVICHFFNRTQARLAAGQEPADALEGAFSGYEALVLAELPKVPAKPAKAAKAPTAEQPAN